MDRNAAQLHMKQINEIQKEIEALHKKAKAEELEIGNFDAEIKHLEEVKTLPERKTPFLLQSGEDDAEKAAEKMLSGVGMDGANNINRRDSYYGMQNSASRLRNSFVEIIAIEKKQLLVDKLRDVTFEEAEKTKTKLEKLQVQLAFLEKGLPFSSRTDQDDGNNSLGSPNDQGSSSSKQFAVGNEVSLGGSSYTSHRTTNIGSPISDSPPNKMSPTTTMISKKAHSARNSSFLQGDVSITTI